MSDPNDDQAGAEAIDEDVIAGDDDLSHLDEDVVRETFPPERPVGLDDRHPLQDVPDRLPPRDEPLGNLLETDDDPDEEVAELGDPELVPPAEEAAVHEGKPPPVHRKDSYLEED
jgi:hypothetical protein